MPQSKQTSRTKYCMALVAWIVLFYVISVKVLQKVEFGNQWFFLTNAVFVVAFVVGYIYLVRKVINSR